jgi:hypothetical protein
VSPIVLGAVVSRTRTLFKLWASNICDVVANQTPVCLPVHPGDNQIDILSGISFASVGGDWLIQY